jgi:hypothetical protein
MAAPSMNAIADEFIGAGVGSFFLYTHEAHPGEHYPHLTSMSQKFRHARALRDVLGVTRPIVVDALDGACHRGYGTMPNMTWIFNRAGMAIYKSDWTDAASVRNALAYFLDTQERRRGGARLAPFHVERLDLRDVDRARFDEGLLRAGPKALEEFRAMFGG